MSDQPEPKSEERIEKWEQTADMITSLMDRQSQIESKLDRLLSQTAAPKVEAKASEGETEVKIDPSAQAQEGTQEKGGGQQETESQTLTILQPPAPPTQRSKKERRKRRLNLKRQK